MAICTKRRRKLQFENQIFFWYIRDCYDGRGYYLSVIAEDKRFLAQYYLSQSEERRRVIISKNYLKEINFGMRGHFRCPQWEIEGVITPRSVRNLLSWCCDRNAKRLQVDYWGCELSS